MFSKRRFLRHFRSIQHLCQQTQAFGEMLLHSRDAYTEPLRYGLGRHLIEAPHYHDAARLWRKLLDRDDQPSQLVAVGELTEGVNGKVSLLQILHGGDGLDRDDARPAEALDAEIAHDLQEVGPWICRLTRGFVSEHASIGVVDQICGLIKITGQASRQFQILPLIREDLINEPMIELAEPYHRITTRLSGSGLAECLEAHEDSFTTWSHLTDSLSCDARGGHRRDANTNGPAARRDARAKVGRRTPLRHHQSLDGIDNVVDAVKVATRLGTDRAHVLREVLMVCRAGGRVSIPGVYGGMGDKIPIGALMEKGLQIRTGQTRVHKYLRSLLDLIGERSVDALMANAGRGLGHGFLDQDWDEARFVIDTDITGTVYLIQKVARDMRDRDHGKILITGSIAGLMPGSFQAVYNGAKAFLDSFSCALRNELRGTGVSVNCLMPGATDTEFFERADMLDTKVGGDP